MMIEKKDNISDNHLVIRISHDDKHAFRSLYDRYNKKIYFFALRYLGNKADAEELVQSVFVNVWENRASLDAALSVKSYIYKAAVNYIYNYLKRKAIRARFVESELVKGEISSNLTYEEVFFHDLERSLNSILGSLPAQQQKIFQLSRNEGKTNNEIATELGLSVRTVENQIYRAMKIIRNYLKEGILLVLILNLF
jgi:RNA polymerase sigma-70 factor, ECF subfamily